MKGKILYIVDSFKPLSETIKTNEFKEYANGKLNIIYNSINDFRPMETYLVVRTSKNRSRASLYWPETDSLIKIRKNKEEDNGQYAKNG